MTDYKLLDKTTDFLSQNSYGLYINNNWHTSASGKFISVIDPSTEKEVAQITDARAEDVDLAVVAANQAFNDPSWKDMSPYNRERLLNKFADILEREHEVVAELLTLENGKLLAQAQSEVISACKTFRYYAGWATKIEGETIDISLKQAPGKKNFSFTRRQPVGVVAAIVPWNFPISIASWKLAPLLAAGCTCVLKPSEINPVSSLYMAQLFKEAGFPDGVVNVITGGPQAGEALTTHKSVDKITFTGSTQVGKLIGKAAMDNMTEVSLELGGKSPAVVFGDADLKEAAKGVAMGIFRNGGQVCVAGSRAYVQDNAIEEFKKLLINEINAMKISDGFDPEATLGPLVSEQHLNRVCSYIETARTQTEHLVGGERLKRIGYYIEPAVFCARDNDNKLAQEEVFGPVLLLVPFSDLEDALKKANDSQYALSSTVWTKDINKAMKCVETLDAGWVFVNSVARSDPHFPLGGNKQSGMGRELGKIGLYNYTKLKAVNIVY